MELKNYQIRILKDLEDYLTYTDESDYRSAYNEIWNKKGVRTDWIWQNSMQSYQNLIENCPNVCLKVPTAWGKTFIWCNALKPIFNHMIWKEEKIVVRFVPSDVILKQTIKNLSNSSHPYRQKLNSLFNWRVEIFTKEQLLQWTWFNPSSIKEQISILVLSFDSFRSNNKEWRKVFQENWYLAQFTESLWKNSVVENADETSLVNILNKLSPVIIIDESHRAKTELSFNALNDLNPSFVLELTATPRKESNIISVASAFELKNEQMVKLPVVAYNMQDKETVVQRAINFQRELEAIAKLNEENWWRYIRPIVIFQAQQKWSQETSEDIASYNKVKEKLIELGIKSEEIAIQTASIKDLTWIDLLSKDCQIRYIITINALKEWWDCPFAYILASLANRKSSVDVEQLLWRILRQPYTKFQSDEMLNFSYVFTSSQKFTETLQNIVKQLWQEWFWKINSRSERLSLEEIEENWKELVVSTNTYIETNNSIVDNNEDLNDFSTENIKLTSNPKFINEIQELAKKTNLEFKRKITDETEISNFFWTWWSDNLYSLNLDYANSLVELPQFFISLKWKTLFWEWELDKKLLEKEDLLDGFNINTCDSKITFEEVKELESIQMIDIEKVNWEASPKYKPISDKEMRKRLLEHISTLPEDKQKDYLVWIVMPKARIIDSLDDKWLREYIKRVIDTMNPDQLEAMKENPSLYTRVIERKIRKLISEYQKGQFKNLIRTLDIKAEKNRKFPQKIMLYDKTSWIQKSLYEEEWTMNDLEKEVINKVASFDNVQWRHRILPSEFFINWFINHYPDFVIHMKSWKTILLETKWDDRDNQDSKDKLELWNLWSQCAWPQEFQYYLVYKDNKIDWSYTINEFLDLLKNL